MNATPVQQPILAIGSGDNFLRIYQGDKELVASAGPAELSGPLEFFDSDGHRLAGVYDQKWQLLALIPTSDQPNLPALLQRVQRTVEHGLRSFAEDNPEESLEFDAEVSEIRAQLPRLRTSADLREFIQTFFARRGTEAAVVTAASEELGADDDPNAGIVKRMWGH